jgi:hypothetical protein
MKEWKRKEMKREYKDGKRRKERKKDLFPLY